MIILKNDFFKKGIKLDTIGVNDVAFNYKETLEFINILEKEKAIIHGGDVLVIVNGIPKYTYDNWCYEGNNSMESIQKAKKYISTYPNKDAIFTIVSNFIFQFQADKMNE